MIIGSIKSEKIFINTDDSIKSEKNSTERDNIKNNIKSEKKSKNSDNNSSSIISEKKSGGGENFQINPINLNLNSNSNCLNVNNIRQFQFQQNQYVSLAKKAINYNNYNLKLNCQKNDMFFLQETYNNAILLSFEKSILFDNIADNKINGNGLAFKDSYMFTFEITPIKEEINGYLKIEVGFKIKYINIQDMNLIIDEKLINKEYINFQIGSLYDSLKIKKKLIIFKRTSIIYILINISRGKFFIIGKEELLKRKQNIFLNKTNTETFFIKNFFPIASISLKNIEPIFNFDKNDLKYYDIKINDKKIKI